MKKIAILTAVAAAIAAVSPASAANLVLNGGFQTTTTTSANGNFQLTNNGTYGTVANWTNSGGYNLLYNANNATSSAGNALGTYTYTGREYLNTQPAGQVATNKFIALDGDSAFRGSISQAINGLVNGQQYTLTFDWSTSSIASRQGAVSAGVTGSFNGQTFSTGEAQIPSSLWSTASYSFTYNSAAGNILSFMGIGTPSGLPPVALLDNVAVNAAVPEPATWAMMLIGFGFVGAMSRSRRRKTVLAAA